MKHKLVIFASGSGSNAVNVCEHFKLHPTIEVSALFCNNPNAGVIAKMKAMNIPVEVFNRETFMQETAFLTLLQKYNPDMLALLGFLWKVPHYLVQAYPKKIINLHPALLPKFGGKGMYGLFVHKAVKEANETKTGITLHWVNEQYDEGEIIAQFTCNINHLDTVETIALKIHALEQAHVPKVIEQAMVPTEPK
jgi:phosphoribosylglycinamide formyltransferase-1